MTGWYSGQKGHPATSCRAQEIFLRSEGLRRKSELWNVPCPSFLCVWKLEPLVHQKHRVDGNLNDPVLDKGVERAVTA